MRVGGYQAEMWQSAFIITIFYGWAIVFDALVFKIITEKCSLLFSGELQHHWNSANAAEHRDDRHHHHPLHPLRHSFGCPHYRLSLQIVRPGWSVALARPAKWALLFFLQCGTWLAYYIPANYCSVLSPCGAAFLKVAGLPSFAVCNPFMGLNLRNSCLEIRGLRMNCGLSSTLRTLA